MGDHFDNHATTTMTTTTTTTTTTNDLPQSTCEDVFSTITALPHSLSPTPSTPLVTVSTVFVVCGKYKAAAVLEELQRAQLPSRLCSPWVLQQTMGSIVEKHQDSPPGLIWVSLPSAKYWNNQGLREAIR